MILASQSPRRRQILEEAGFEFRTLPSSFDESRIEERDPRRLVLHLAAGKASDVCDQAEAGENRRSAPTRWSCSTVPC